MLLAARHLGGVPVVAGSRVVGVISMSDILSFEASTSPVPALEPDRVEWGLEPEEWRDGDEATAAYFGDFWSHRLPVLDQGGLGGVLSAMDLVRAVAEGRL